VGVDSPVERTVEAFSSELVSELRSRDFEIAVGPGDPSEYLLRADSLDTEIGISERWVMQPSGQTSGESPRRTWS
jgi:hypothetical protein